MFLFFSILIYFFIFFFDKKLIALLILEASFLCLILFLIYSFVLSSVAKFFPFLIFLTFMVLDSVLGISLLILSSRNSTLMFSNL